MNLSLPTRGCDSSITHSPMHSSTPLHHLTVADLIAILRDHFAPSSTSPTDPKMKRAVTVKRCAELVGLSRSTIYRRVWIKKIRASKVGTRWIIPYTEVERLIDGD